MKLGRSALFVAAVAVFLAGCTELTARRAVQQGNRDYGEGRYEEAIASFEEAIRLVPGLDVAHHNAALSYIKDMRPGVSTDEEKAKAKKATEHFETYLKLNPKDDNYEGIRNILVKTYMDAGLYDGALAVWQRELDKNPNDAKAIASMAQINVEAGHYDEALALRRRQIDMARDNGERVQAYSAIGQTENARLRGGMEIVGAERLAIADRGIEATQAAIKLQPDNYFLYYLAGSLYEQRSLTYDVRWLANIDYTDSVIYRIKGSELYKAQQSKAAADVGAASGDDKSKDGDKPAEKN